MTEKKQEDELYISWRGDSLNKIFTINCRCGNNKFIKAQLGVRCLECNMFHSYIAWEEAKKKIRTKRRYNGIRDEGDDTRAIDVMTIKRKPKIIGGKVVWQNMGMQRDSDKNEERAYFLNIKGEKII